MGKKKNEKGLTRSGRFRAQAAYYDETGRRRVKSFTADTLEEAQYLAMLWKTDHDNKDRMPRITAADAVDKYIEMKRAVLSPATVRGYTFIYETHIKEQPIGRIYVEDLTNTNVQIWISTLAASCSPKTVRNIFMLFKASVLMFDPDLRLHITLPPKVKSDHHCPSDADIRCLIDKIREKHGSDSELEIAVLLAAFGTLRRGEICALTSDDFSGCTIHVCKGMVQDEFGSWDEKAPKTYESDRTVELPGFVIDKLKGKQGRIVNCTPDAITRRFKDVLAETDLEYFRFHDLRHYSASIMHAIGVPDQYIMARGGWASDNVMKSVYRNVIDIEQARQTLKINTYFTENFR